MTVNVKQLQHHQATKLVDCRVFIRIFTGTKSATVAQETTELLSTKRGTFLCLTVYIFHVRTKNLTKKVISSIGLRHNLLTSVFFLTKFIFHEL